MKKKILKIVIIVISIFMLIKICNYLVLLKIYKSLENFKSESNRYYSVSINDGEKVQEIYSLDSELLYKVGSHGNFKYMEIRRKSASYAINFLTKEIYTRDFSVLFNNALSNIPEITKRTDNLISNAFSIKYICFSKYNDINCIKIITKSGKIYIDLKTFLPIYMVKRHFDSENKLKEIVEYNYKFEVGTVTENDVAMPDISEYKLIEN